MVKGDSWLHEYYREGYREMDMSDGWDRLQRLAKRVAKEGHPDREVQQSWADELAVAVLHMNEPDKLRDITAPAHGVQIQIKRDSKVIWVHVDGVSVLRICQIPSLELVDERGANAIQESGTKSDGEEGREVGVV